MARSILPGKPYPQGATWDGTGVNFSLYSERAAGVELCLFDAAIATNARPSRCANPPATSGTATFPASSSGQLYGYRVHGPYEPERGDRFNPAKLLIDPYAKALAGKLNWDAPVFGYKIGDKAAGPFLRPRRRCVGRSQVRRHHLAFRLGERPPAADAAARFGHLRAPRQGLHRAASRDSRGTARHLRGPGASRWPSNI